MRPAAVALPARAALPAVRVRARADVLALGGLAAIVAVLAALTWLAWGDLTSDTGYDWLAAERIAAHGQVPYVDFPYWYGPLGVGLLAGAYAVLGVGMTATVTLGLLLAVAAIGLTYALARCVAGPPAALAAGALAAAAAFATGNVNLVVPHAVTVPVAVVLSLAALLAAARVAAGGPRALLAAAGLATGLVALTRPEFVAALAVALALWLVLRRSLRDAALVAAPALLVPLLGYGAVVAQGVSVGELVRDDLLATSLLQAGGEHLLRIAAPLTVGSFAALAGHLALYAAGCAALVALARLPRRWLTAGAAVALVAVVAVALARPDAVRARLDLAFAWIPAGAVLAAAWLAWRARRAAWPARDQAALLVAAFLAVLAAKTYAAFYPQPNPDVAQYASYAMPFAAVFLVWLHGAALAGGDGRRALAGLAWVGALAAACVVLTAVDGTRESATVHTARGTAAVPPAQRATLQGAIDAVQARTRPGEPILVAPQLSWLPVLTSRDQPLRPVSLLPGALDQRRAIAVLQRRGVRLAVIGRRPLTEYGHGPFGTTFDARLGAWLRERFTHVATLPGPDGAALDLWERTTHDTT